MGDSNVDVSAQIAELMKWHDDANTEIKAVRQALDEVSKVCRELDGDDTVYGWFKKCGEAIGETYVEMCNVFDKAMDTAKDVVQDLGKGIKNIGEGISNWIKSFSR